MRIRFDALAGILWLAGCASDAPVPQKGSPPTQGPIDADGDGYTEDEDCDDTNPDAYPGAAERCDGIDNDCDGDTDDADADVVDPLRGFEDADGDGFGDPERAVEVCTLGDGVVDNGSDCDDTDPSRNPAAEEVWYDGTDQDCRGGSDYDAEGDGEDADA